MKKTVYDFRGAAVYAEQWFTPKELSDNLKSAALRCANPDNGIREAMVLNMQLTVLDVCDFLESITETEVEQ